MIREIPVYESERDIASFRSSGIVTCPIPESLSALSNAPPPDATTILWPSSVRVRARVYIWLSAPPMLMREVSISILMVRSFPCVF